ncbi:MAG: TSUP family transporter [Luteitalea sp.]|nr:TSUP family transporter [Luteitalea sp.]
MYAVGLVTNFFDALGIGSFATTTSVFKLKSLVDDRVIPGTLGIGLYAPAMIMVSLLGMSPAAAFPIMMGSCAFLMPVGSLQFIRKGSYDWRAARGLALGGIPGVLIAAYLVKSLPLSAVRWLVVVVVVYAATMLLRAARHPARQPGPSPASALEIRAPDDLTR